MIDYTTHEEINLMVKMVHTFLKLAKNTKKYNKNLADVKLAMMCAKKVEDVYSTLKSKLVYNEFIKHLRKTLKLDEDKQFEYSCDTILEAVLTSEDASSSCVIACVKDYVDYCGNLRFNKIVTLVITRSEVCRVLLDFIGTTVADKQARTTFQACLLFKILTSKENEAAVMRAVCEWLHSEDQFCINVAFEAISMGGTSTSVSKFLINGLTSVLEERQESSLLYWSALVSSPVAISVLKESRLLIYASLDFLCKTGENFKHRSPFSWKSLEKGPCKIISFEDIVQYFKFLYTAGCPLDELVNIFFEEKYLSPGLTFWEDVMCRVQE